MVPNSCDDGREENSTATERVAASATERRMGHSFEMDLEPCMSDIYFWVPAEGAKDGILPCDSTSRRAR